jgi:hypothetical protein
MSPWLERTGWERTYEGIDRVLLRNLTSARPPLSAGLSRIVPKSLSGHDSSHGDHEQKIAALLVVVDMVMDRCEHTARTTSRSLLCWLRSVRPHGCYGKPFTFVGKVASRKKYIMLLKRFIAMVFRAYCLPAEIRRRKAGILFKKSQMRLIATIWKHRVWTQPGATGLGFWKLITAQSVPDQNR